MMMSATAIESPNLMWQAMVPISIENGFDLYTHSGRDKAWDYLVAEEPDVIIAEWMCDP